MNCAFALLFAIFNATAIPMMKCWCAVCKFCIIARYSWMTRMIHSRETQGVGGRGLAHGIAGRSTPCSSNARMTGEKQLFFFYRFTLFFKNGLIVMFCSSENLKKDKIDIWFKIIKFYHFLADCGILLFGILRYCVHYKNRHVYIWLSCHFVRTWLL